VAEIYRFPGIFRIKAAGNQAKIKAVEIYAALDLFISLAFLLSDKIFA